MRQEHRQGTGFFRHLPLFFAIIGLLAGGLVSAARGAEGADQSPGQPSVEIGAGEDLSEDDALLEMYFEWLLRQMRVPVPANASVSMLADVFIQAFREQGVPNLRPLAEVQFTAVLVSMQVLVVTGQVGLDVDQANELLEVIAVMLRELGGTEGQVAE